MRNSVVKCLFLFWVVFVFGCENGRSGKIQKNDRDSIEVSPHPELLEELEESTDSADTLKADKIDKLVRKLERYRQFNGVILVAENGRIIYKGEIGNAIFNPDIAANENTPFHLASVSKQFTAGAVMLLAAEGKLRFDDTVSMYLPELPYKNITIRQLLNHTSGVPRITNYIPNYLKYWDSCRIAEVEDIPVMLSIHAPPREYNPGRRFAYNNTGYILLASIIERVSGLSYGEFIEKRIFQPLGMKNSFVYNIHDMSDHEDRACGYGIYRRSYVPDEDDIRNGLLGEKGIYASAADLYKWDQALYTNVLFPDSLLREAYTRGKLLNGKEINYGFGWRLLPREDSLVYHFGHWRGFRSAIVRVLDDRVTVIALNNTGTRRLRYLVSKVLDILYEDRQDKPDF